MIPAWLAIVLCAASYIAGLGTVYVWVLVVMEYDNKIEEVRGMGDYDSYES